MSRKCPTCGSSDMEIMFELCSNMAVMGKGFPDSTCNNVVCKTCGCVYVDSDADQSLYTNYYNSQSSTGINYYAMFGQKQTEDYYRHIYLSIKDHINYDSEILDCGSGLGDFCVYLKSLGYKNVLGIDPSAASVKIAVDKGANCHVDDAFSENQSFVDRFDLIILSHVLEHILDAKEALVNLKKMLKPGGKIYIEVPDSERYCDVTFAPFFFFTYEHLSHYSLIDFKNISVVADMTLVEDQMFLKCESYYVISGLLENFSSFDDICYSDRTKKAIEKYAEYSRNQLSDFITPLELSRKPLILWGIGASTAQLLSGTFDKCNVVMLIDKNPARQGLTFRVSGGSLVTMSPECIVDETATIVILPVMYKDSILQEIRSREIKNEIISLKE